MKSPGRTPSPNIPTNMNPASLQQSLNFNGGYKLGEASFI